MSEDIQKNVEKTRKNISKFLSGIDSKTSISQYHKESESIRDIGEVWTDGDDYTWEQKNGYKAKIRKIDRSLIADTGAVGDTCPKCGKYVKKHRNDWKMYRLNKMCFDCWVHIETEMRILGTYKEYERTKVKANMISYVRLLENEMEDYVKEITNKITFLNIPNKDTVAVDVERWSALSDEQIEEIKSKYANEIIYTRDLYEKK